MMKKFVSMVLAAALLLTLALPAGAASLPFRDVSDTAWYAPAVEYVYTHKLFQGTTQDQFEPSKPMNRAMFVQVLANKTSSYSKADWEKKNSFSDVRQGKWYAPPIAWATKAGLANGIGNGRFGWNQNVTRQQAAVFIYKYAQKTGNDASFDSNALAAFSDADEVAGWAKEAVQWAVTHGVMNGSNGKLNPNTSATRAQVAQFFAAADPLLQKTVVDVEPGPDEPDPFSKEPYRAVIQEISAAQNSMLSYYAFFRGFFYDLDGDGMEELIMMHEAGSGYSAYRAASVYTIRDGKAVALMKNQKLFDEVSSPQGALHVMTKGGATYLGVFDRNGGFSDATKGMVYNGKWLVYRLNNGKLNQTNRVEFLQYDRAPQRNNAKIDGKSVTYAQYQAWEKGYSKKVSIVSSGPAAYTTGGLTAQQLLNQI